MSKNQSELTNSADEALIEAEVSGIRLAILGRTLALVLIGTFMVLTRLQRPSHAFELFILFAGFILIGLIYLKFVGSSKDRPWLKFLVITVDVAVLSILMATQPLFDSIDVPQVMSFRNSIFPFYFLLLGVAAISFSPALVLWTGCVGVIGWMSAFAWAIKDMPFRLTWTDIGTEPTTEHFLSIFMNPNFIALGSRIQESFAYLVVAILIAFVMKRARQTVHKQVALDQERRMISDVFGQFVPAAVANAMITDQGVLEPVEREATILFVDLADFTHLTEQRGAAGIVEILNDYFDQAAQIISNHNGVITQFQGDAILATFNVPLEDANHRDRAFEAAMALNNLVCNRTFGGTRLSVRIGLGTGQVIAGNVGGGGRKNYTVHGDTVNLAARLEALNKTYETSILIAEQSLTDKNRNNCRLVDEVQVRGTNRSLKIFTPHD